MNEEHWMEFKRTGDPDQIIHYRKVDGCGIQNLVSGQWYWWVHARLPKEKYGIAATKEEAMEMVEKHAHQKPKPKHEKPKFRWEDRTWGGGEIGEAFVPGGERWDNWVGAIGLSQGGNYSATPEGKWFAVAREHNGGRFCLNTYADTREEAKQIIEEIFL